MTEATQLAASASSSDPLVGLRAVASLRRLLGGLGLGGGVGWGGLVALGLCLSRVRPALSARVAAGGGGGARAGVGIEVGAGRRGAGDSCGRGALQRALAGPYRGYGKTP